MAGTGDAVPVDLVRLGDAVREFLCEELGYEPEEIAADTPLFTSGMVDSFTFVGMIALIETAIGCELDPRSITVENFDSIGRTAAFLATLE